MQKATWHEQACSNHFLSMHHEHAMLACEQRSLLQPYTCCTVRQCLVCASTVWQKITYVFLMVAPIAMLVVGMPSLRANSKCIVQPKNRCASKCYQSALFDAMKHRDKQIPHGQQPGSLGCRSLNSRIFMQAHGMMSSAHQQQYRL